jgi:tetratricopeptide (TPR) repeat protein
MKSTISKPKAFIFRILLILIPFFVLIIFEGPLRLFGYGENLELFVTLEKNQAYWITNPNVGRRYFQQKDFLPATSYDAFRKQKPEDGYRIFVLGGSTTAGFPYFNNGSFPRMLKTRLQDRYSELHIEMVNLAMPAVNSYTLLDFADELVRYSPDAVLIYAGHNEFYGAFGSGSTEFLGLKRWPIKLYLRLQHFRLVQLTRDVIFLAKSKPAREGNTLMARMVRQKEIPFGDKVYNSTLHAFRANLSDIIGTFQSHGVKVMLGELVSNLKDHEPFSSSFEENTDRKKWQEFYAKGTELAKPDSYMEAIGQFEKAIQIDDLPANVHFELAKCLMKTNEINAARQAYLKAKDLDALRFRASEDFNQVIWELGDKFNIPVVPMVVTFSQASPNGLVGNNLMLDHLHPNLRGHELMARAFSESMEDSRFFPSGQRRKRVQSDSYYWERRGITALDEELASIRMQVLLSNWPFKPDITDVTPLQYAPQNRLEELALAQWQEELSWDAAHMQLAQYYEQDKETEKAVQEYDAIIKGMPYAVSPYLRLGLSYLAVNKVEEASAVFEQSLNLEKTATAQKWLGSISIHKNELKKGLEYLTEALQDQPDDPEILFNMSVGLAKSGDFAEAIRYAEELVQKHPGYPGSEQHLQKLKSIGAPEN